MDDRRIEQLLRDRSRGLPRRLATPEFERRAQAALEAEMAAGRGRRLRLLAPLLALAAAAAVALVLLWGRPAPPALHGVTVELALLDEGGRELAEGAGVRGPDEELPRPEQVRLELVPLADGFARAFLYDAGGRLREPREGVAVELRADVAALLDFRLDGAWTDAPAGGGLTWVVAVADAPFPAEGLGLPERLAAPDPEGRRAEASAVAARASAATGCRVVVRHLE